MSKALLPLAIGVAAGFTGGLLIPGQFSTTVFAIGMTLAPLLVGPFPDAPKNSPLDGLRVPKTEYGGAVPRFYGRARTAGTWIDAPDDGAVTIQKTTKKRKVGLFKSQSYDEFAYFLTAAYGLGDGRLVVEKLWANDVLIFDRSGEDETERGYTFVEQTVGSEVVAELHENLRFYRGSRKQAPDSALAALHGGQACAYRGTAYIVFNRFALAAFDNAIPNFTAQVRRVDAAGGVIDDVAQIIRLECEGADIPGEVVSVPHLEGKRVHGIAITSRGPRRAVVEQAARWHHCGVADVGGSLVSFSRATPRVFELREEQIGAFEWTGNGQSDDRQVRRNRAAALGSPSHFSLRCSNPNRDYEVTPFEHIWQSAPAYLPEQLDVLIVAPDSEAAPRAAIYHEEKLVARSGARVMLALDCLEAAPGDVLKIPIRNDDGTLEIVCIIVDEQTLSTVGLLECIGSGWDGEIYSRVRPTVVDVLNIAGRVNAGAPVVAAFNIATNEKQWLDNPAFLSAGCVPDGDWNGVEVRSTTPSPWSPYSRNGWGLQHESALGTLVEPFPIGDTTNFDLAVTMRVQLLVGELASTTEQKARDENANLLAIGNAGQGGRFVQFLTAIEDVMIPGLYVLSGLRDGVFNSDQGAPLVAGSFVIPLFDADGDELDGPQWVELGGNDNGKTATFRPYASPPRGRANGKNGDALTQHPNNGTMKPAAPLVSLAREAGGVRLTIDARPRLNNTFDKLAGQFAFDVSLVSLGHTFSIRLSSGSTHLEKVWSDAQLTTMFGDVPTHITGEVRAASDVYGDYPGVGWPRLVDADVTPPQPDPAP